MTKVKARAELPATEPRGKKAGADAGQGSGAAARGTDYLVVTGLTRRFGPPHFQGIESIEFGAAKGAFVSILGPSGCGKTTTLGCIAGIVRPDEGEISISGTAVWSAKDRIDVPPHKRDIGMVFQSYALWPHMTVGENVAYPLQCRRAGKRVISERVRAMLGLVGLEHMESRLPGTLSGGQQQRVALARALVYEPRLLLFDEPLSNLDPRLRDEMRHDIRRVQQEMGTTALYVTHDRAEALSISDHIIVMADGRIVEQGKPRELLYDPESTLAAKLLSSQNLFEGRVESVEPRQDGYVATVLVETEDGSRIAMKAAVRDRLDIQAPVTVGLRPGDLTLSASPAETADTRTIHSLPGRITDVSRTGIEVEYTVDLGGPTARAVSLQETGADVGDAVQMSYRIESARCFT